MSIEAALKITGFLLCEFKSKGNEDVYCDCCEKDIPKGEDIYYQRTSYECEEGNYYCTECTIAMPDKWKQECDHWAKLAETVTH